MVTLIFDLDGTLLDCRARHYAVYSDILRELGYEPLPEPDYWRHRRAGQGTFDVLCGLPESDAMRFRVDWMNRIERRDYLALDKPFGGVAPALAELSRYHRIVLLTLRRDADGLDWQLEKTGFAPYLSEVISQTNVFTARKSELMPDWFPIGETWVIGDTEADIDLAADLGCYCVCLTNGVRSEDYLRARGGLLFEESISPLVEMFPALAHANGSRF